jgi:uncharacterized protein (TIGR00369 family)
MARQATRVAHDCRAGSACRALEEPTLRDAPRLETGEIRTMADTTAPAGFAFVQRLFTGETPMPPIARLLGIRIVSAEPGHVVMELEAGPHLANPMGTLHGGVLCDLADAAMGMCYFSKLEAGETFTTLELKINYLRPVWKDRLRAEATMVKGGRTVGLVECRVLTAAGQLVAHATSTCMTLRGEQAQGR